MHTTWGDVREELLHSIGTLAAQQEFLEVCAHHPPLAAYTSPSAVVGYLARREGDPVRKNATLAALVQAVQRREDRGLCLELLWLGLWPGLDAVCRRRQSHFESSEDFLSAISSAFVGLVAKLNLQTVHWVAASLVRSTERDLMSELRHEWATAVITTPFDHGESWEAPPVRDQATESNLRNAHELLRCVAGRDGDLLFRVLVLGEEQGEAGEELGLTKAAARKRFARALPRVRERLRRLLSQDNFRFRVFRESRRSTNSGGIA
jgi:DNA-directed RNA polymerase specialized sigma24 family protein